MAKFHGGKTSAETSEEVYAQYMEYVDQLHASRYGPYSGTFAAKRLGLIEIGGDWTAKSARDHCWENNNVTEPAYIYKLPNNEWWIGGWCPE